MVSWRSCSLSHVVGLVSATPAASDTERWCPECRGLSYLSFGEGLGVGFPPPYGGGEGGGALQTTLKSHAAEDGSQDSNDKLENGFPLVFVDFGSHDVEV